MSLNKNDHIFLIGIGGAGMSALAFFLNDQGYVVSGSDVSLGALDASFKQRGITTYASHHPDHINDATVVAYSTAISPDNPEYQAAIELKKPLLHRSELMHKLIQPITDRICVTGTHGKTTTTAWIVSLLTHIGETPSYLVGSPLSESNCQASYQSAQRVVVEADESDGSFLNLSPTLTVITNIEEEHMSFFESTQNMLNHYRRFMEQTWDNDGCVVYNADDKHLHQLAQANLIQSCSFSINQPSMLQAKDIEHTPHGIQFKVSYQRKESRPIKLNLFGIHNVYNALAAIATGLQSGFEIDALLDAIEPFHGTQRRFESIGSINDIDIYDDYAHHPTEIKTTLAGIKHAFNRRLVCIFQPHRYSRTKELYHDFPSSFSDADHIVVTDIYEPCDIESPTITSESFAELMSTQLNTVTYVANTSDIVSEVIPTLQQGDIVITMGAGDIHQVSSELMTSLKTQGD